MSGEQSTPSPTSEVSDYHAPGFESPQSNAKGSRAKELGSRGLKPDMKAHEAILEAVAKKAREDASSPEVAEASARAAVAAEEEALKHASIMVRRVVELRRVRAERQEG